jgi:hypothetical protein
MTDHNTRMFVVGDNGTQARAVATRWSRSPLTTSRFSVERPANCPLHRLLLTRAHASTVSRSGPGLPFVTHEVRRALEPVLATVRDVAKTELFELLAPGDASVGLSIKKRSPVPVEQGDPDGRPLPHELALVRRPHAVPRLGP